MIAAIALLLGAAALIQWGLLVRSLRQLAAAEAQCDIWRNAAIANDAENRALAAEVAYWHGQTWERQNGLQVGLAAAVEILTARNGEQITVYRN